MQMILQHWFIKWNGTDLVLNNASGLIKVGDWFMMGNSIEIKVANWGWICWLIYVI
jgi:hypothetical protein